MICSLMLFSLIVLLVVFWRWITVGFMYATQCVSKAESAIYLTEIIYINRFIPTSYILCCCFYWLAKRKGKDNDLADAGTRRANTILNDINHRASVRFIPFHFARLERRQSDILLGAKAL